MIEIKEKHKCCGCHACANICPRGAIEMKKDEQGFLYPIIDKEKCINCEKCKKVCPIINKKNEIKLRESYACINKNEEVRLNSSSGGIFTLIAEVILDANGIVFGAQYDEELNVVHSYTEKKEDLYKFRGAKYVQSVIGDNYKKAQKFLEEGKQVLFTGTPCQIEGLYAFLQKKYENLYTQDIICHGVPSPKVWNAYKSTIEKINNSKMIKMNFRDKTNGWVKYSIKYTLQSNKDKTFIESSSNNKYMKSFLKNFSLRDSCYSCNFKSKDRNSDITLADFWGIENVDPKMNDNKGTSLVIVNSPKGKKIFEKIKEKIIFEKVDLEQAIKYNSSMIRSAERPKDREKFFTDLGNDNNKNADFYKTIDKYMKENKIISFAKKIKRVILRKKEF